MERFPLQPSVWSVEFLRVEQGRVSTFCIYSRVTGDFHFSHGCFLSDSGVCDISARQVFHAVLFIWHQSALINFLLVTGEMLSPDKPASLTCERFSAAEASSVFISAAMFANNPRVWVTWCFSQFVRGTGGSAADGWLGFNHRWWSALWFLSRWVSVTGCCGNRGRTEVRLSSTVTKRVSAHTQLLCNDLNNNNSSLTLHAVSETTNKEKLQKPLTCVFYIG